jgi:hypothetical protein
MTDTTSSMVQRLWENEQCVAVNGIHLPSDKIVQLDFRVISPEEVASFIVGETSGADAHARQPNMRSSLGPPYGIAAPEGKVIVAGDGGSGSDGFVAVCSGAVSNLVWLAFFDFSNPFEEDSVRIVDSRTFSARTEYGAEWLFSFDDPTKIVVKRGDVGWPRSHYWSTDP